MRRRVQIGTTWLLLAGCGTPAVVSSEAEQYVDAGHIRFFFPPDQPACAGTPIFLNATLERLADFLGVEPPERLEYHYRPTGDLVDVCGDAFDYAGCSFPGQARVWSRDATSIHELVHALANQDGAHYSFLSEGLAIALGEQNTSLSDYDAPESTYLTPEPQSPAKNGGIAGDLVSHLLQEFGAARFMDLYRRVASDATSEGFKAEFAAVYELDFDALFAERRESKTRFSENRLRFPECSLPQSEWAADQWVSTLDVDCSVDGIGPSTRLSALSAAVWRGQSLEVPTEGTFNISFSGKSAGAKLYRCDLPQESWSFTAPTGPFRGQAVGQHSLTHGRLPAGKYALLSHGNELDQPVTVSLALEPSIATEPECARQAPLAVPAGVDGLYLIAEPTATARRFEVETVSRASAAFSEAKLCDDQCGACTPVPQFDSLLLEPGVTYALELAGDSYRQADGIQLTPDR